MNLRTAMIVGRDGPPFGLLLRTMRLKAGLTQMQLAERAELSLRAVAALEYGERRAPYRHTVAALVRALDMAPEAVERFQAAAISARPSLRSSNLQRVSLGNLPYQETTFVGRTKLLLRAVSRLEAQRSVILSGRGGVGKTRMALVLAARLARRFEGGAWLVDLSHATDESGILTKICSTIGEDFAHGGGAIALTRALARRNILLILDNCEAAAEACAYVIETVLRRCPAISVIATSTSKLATTSASTIHVPPLDTPGKRAMSSASELLSFAGSELFVERCGRYGCSFELSKNVIALVASISNRLEGIPLAIELAASRAATLGLARLEATLEQWHERPNKTVGDVPPRHRSLFAAIDWSYELLNETERLALRRLSVFTGSFDLSAARAVCGTRPLKPSSIPGLIASLADKSLISTGSSSSLDRWRLFDSTRSYARKRLEATEDAAQIRKRHAAYFANYVSQGTQRYFSSESVAWTRAVQSNEDDIDAAMHWAAREGNGVKAAQLAGAMRLVWALTCRFRKAQDIADALLARIDHEANPREAADLFLTRALNLKGEEAVNAYDRAVELYERSTDPFGRALANSERAIGLMSAGRIAEAHAALDLAAAFIEAASDPVHGMPRFSLSIRARRGYALWLADRFDEASIEIRAGLEIADRLRDDFARRRLRALLAETSFATGNADAAVALLEEDRREARLAGDTGAESLLLSNLAGYRLLMGDVDAASICVREALSLANFEPFGLACVLQHAATIMASRGNAADAARLSGYVDNFREGASFKRERTEERAATLLSELLDRALPASERAALVSQGSSLSEDAAVRIGRGLTDASRADETVHFQIDRPAAKLEPVPSPDHVRGNHAASSHDTRSRRRRRPV